MFGCITASLPLVGYMLSNQQTNHITSRFWTSIVLYIRKLVCLSTQQDRWHVRELRLIQVRYVKSGRNMTLSGGEKRIKEVE